MEETKKNQSADINTIKNIIENYRQKEKALVDQLYFTTSHGPTIGGFREQIWKGMFEQIIPKKFAIGQSVFIIDSEGRVSKEVDLAIFDETYTPYIFYYGRLKFIPIEAVAAVVECKSNSWNQEKLKEWTESIMPLTTSLKSYTRIAGKIAVGENKESRTQTKTRPLRILCCLTEESVSKTLENEEALFDMIVRAPAKGEGLKIEITSKKENLQDWYLALNHAGCQPNKKEESSFTDLNIYPGSELAGVKLNDFQVKGEDDAVSLLSFNFQLNQLLMLINNPIPFPHMAYAELFRDMIKGEKTNE